MADTVPVVGNTFTFGVPGLYAAGTANYQANPTIAAGDFQISTNGGAFENPDNLPAVTPAAGYQVVCINSAAETTAAGDGGFITWVWFDAAGSEWDSGGAVVRVHPQDLDTVAGYTSAGKAEVQAEANDALVALDLDHLIETTAGSEEPTDGTYLDQIMHKSASQTFDATTDSLEALRDHIGPTATVTVVAGVSGDAITVVPYTTWEFTISGLADLSGAVAGTGVLFTVKADKADADSAAILQVRETTGLIYIDGVAGTAAKGSLTVDAGEDEIVVHVNASQTAIMPQTCVWDIKQVITTVEDADQMASGVFTISETGITRENTAA